VPYIAHATTSVVNPITVKEFMDFVCNFYKEHPLKHGKLVPEVEYIDGERRFQLKHFLKFSLPEKFSTSHTYKKLTQLDLEMHRLFGFFTSTEFLFSARYKEIILESPWNKEYFNHYLENLGNQLSRDFEEWKKKTEPITDEKKRRNKYNNNKSD